ncbi:hypothetical protein [Desertimonas flava]|uniref:hypothetical protein n=1 Tax=Desertimonas flava TaxID=2064846 RepID=UPI0013C48CD2|nr:hypothetical protein [Desertimonas flava]
MTDAVESAEGWAQVAYVSVAHDGPRIEQETCDGAESVARIVESWQAQQSPTVERIIIEPHPPELIVELLRAIADAIEREQPMPLSHPLPPLRLEMTAGSTTATPPGRVELRLLMRELAHPGD